MLGEAITILLLLCAAAVCFIRQKKYFYLQATIPLSLVPLTTLVMHSFIMNLTHTTQGFNRMVCIFYGAAALLTVIWVAVICTKLTKPLHRIVYAVTVCAFDGLLCVLFLQANLL